MARKNGVAEFTLKGNLLSWDFNGAGVVGIDVIELFPEYPVMNEAQQGVVRNGIKQKLADSIAGLASNADRYDRMAEVRDTLLRGEWTARPPADPAVAILAEAIADVDGRELKKCREYVKGLKPASVAALSAHPLYKAAVDRIVASRTANVDVAALLGEIGEI